MTTTYHQEKDKVVIERNIDYKPIVEHNKKLYSQNNGYSKSKDLKRVASIPTLVLEIWSKEYMVVQIGLHYRLMFKKKY